MNQERRKLPVKRRTRGAGRSQGRKVNSEFFICVISNNMGINILNSVSPASDFCFLVFFFLSLLVSGQR